MFKEFLQTLGPRARWSLLAGAALIVAATVGLATWLLRTDYQVLFADLKAQDAAVMVAELERQKVPYQLADGGATILVEGRNVHSTRLKLMGKDLPLHGTTGFELFNNGDFGMTEFAQKVNYQRALQGEITRTILSLAEVKEARVHLALPEEGLFKRAGNKPKAAITLGLKTGASLRPDQVQGIQRLVAAAVPGVAVQDVTIVDLQGVALTRVAATDAEPDAGTSSRLDLKRDTEKMLTRKATEVLERAFGAGHAMATVDVTLNMDQVRVTTEDVIGAPGRAGQASAGVIVREREVLRDIAAPLSSGSQGDARGGNSQREVEYQVGRRVEHVVTQPGTIRRLHVAAVVRQPLEPQQLEQARALITAAVGGVPERGDTIVVQTLSAFTAPAQAAAPAAVPAAVPAANEVPESTLNAAPADTPVPAAWALAGAVVAALLLLCAALAWKANQRRGRVARLTPAERQALAAQMQLWLAEPETPTGARLPAGGAAQGRL